jgi:hypothetical protein
MESDFSAAPGVTNFEWPPSSGRARDLIGTLFAPCPDHRGKAKHMPANFLDRFWYLIFAAFILAIGAGIAVGHFTQEQSVQATVVSPTG